MERRGRNGCQQEEARPGRRDGCRESEDKQETVSWTKAKVRRSPPTPCRFRLDPHGQPQCRDGGR